MITELLKFGRNLFGNWTNIYSRCSRFGAPAETFSQEKRSDELYTCFVEIVSQAPKEALDNGMKNCKDLSGFSALHTLARPISNAYKVPPETVLEVACTAIKDTRGHAKQQSNSIEK